MPYFFIETVENKDLNYHSGAFMNFNIQIGNYYIDVRLYI